MAKYFLNLGEPVYRAQQVWEGLYVNLNNAAGEFSVSLKKIERYSRTGF